MTITMTANGVINFISVENNLSIHVDMRLLLIDKSVVNDYPYSKELFSGFVEFDTLRNFFNHQNPSARPSISHPERT